MYVEWRWEWTFEILPQMLWATLNTFLAAGLGYTIAAVVELFPLFSRMKMLRHWGGIVDI